MDGDPAAAALADGLDQITRSLDFAWLFMCVVLVILMQAGFAAYEVRFYACVHPLAAYLL